MKFDRTVLKINVYGEECEVTKPLALDLKWFKEKLTELGDGNELEAAFLYLERLGLPRRLSEKLELEHMNQLMEALNPAKKV